MTDENPTPVEHGTLLWEPTEATLRSSRLWPYLRWLEAERGLTFPDRTALWTWSTQDQEAFWRSIWDYFDVLSSVPPERMLANAEMPGARWFPGARLNYAEQVFRFADDDRVAVHGYSQTREPVRLTLGELRDQVGRARRVLQDLGAGPGDRVVAYVPNIPEAVVAFLATASLGAVWASCAIEFGARSVLERFGQVEPTVLLTVAGYGYGTKWVDRTAEVDQVVAGLPTLRGVLDLGYGGRHTHVPHALDWTTALEQVGPQPLEFEQVPSDHPLFVLFSSGTTGLPKAIVHGHGGILLEHLKNHALSWDLGPGDVFLWYSTTAWMMWNALVSGLVVGSGIVCIDGHPMHPGTDWQWQLAAETGATVMGAAPGLVMASRKEGLTPATDHDLAVRVFASAGAPLPPEGYAWVYEQLPHVVLNVGSGGTDICSGIVQGDPWTPVWAGEISGPAFGVAACAFDEQGRPVVGSLGELVITAPLPSMPVGFWGDDDGSRLRATYFDTFPGVWRHGDWILFAPEGHCHVAGRSDATLNRGGVRLGTAEFYRVTEEIPGVADSLVVHLEEAGGNGQLLLLVQTEPGQELDDELRGVINRALRTQLSPRHVPDTIVQVPVVPRNRTGKKLELPVKRILQGHPLEQVASRDALADQTSLDPIVALATQH
ncbi:acetoacetate--CoA ligase [Ornithinimicrobium sp. LYQ103]|uniref:acetoacetate--CoA ligase n=1 Tax=Ornithinimicrobium sp. LYQ103 TaxID=3378796 RepID=UPI0038536BA7